jgi:hypothetical protein
MPNVPGLSAVALEDVEPKRTERSHADAPVGSDSKKDPVSEMRCVSSMLNTRTADGDSGIDVPVDAMPNEEHEEGTAAADDAIVGANSADFAIGSGTRAEKKVISLVPDPTPDPGMVEKVKPDGNQEESEALIAAWYATGHVDEGV